MDEFLSSLQPTDTALFYFSGHGICRETHGTFCVPSDATVSDFPNGNAPIVREQVKRCAWCCKTILAEMERRASLGVSIAFVDACRVNELMAPLSLADFSVRGSFVAYACWEQGAALEADPQRGGNSLFTACLLDHLDADSDISLVMRRTAADVYRAHAAQRTEYVDRLFGGSLVLRDPPAAVRVRADNVPPIISFEAAANRVVLRTSSEPRAFLHIIDDGDAGALGEYRVIVATHGALDTSRAFFIDTRVAAWHRPVEASAIVLIEARMLSVTFDGVSGLVQAYEGDVWDAGGELTAADVGITQGAAHRDATDPVTWTRVTMHATVPSRAVRLLGGHWIRVVHKDSGTRGYMHSSVLPTALLASLTDVLV